MKNNKQLRLVILVAVIVIVIIALISKSLKKPEQKQVAETNTNNDGTTVIAGEKLAEVKSYKGLEVSNVKFEIDDKRTRLRADVYNGTDKEMEAQWININILDQEGNRITSIGGFIGKVKPGETTPISSSILSKSEDTKAYDIEITETREPVKAANGNQDTL